MNVNIFICFFVGLGLVGCGGGGGEVPANTAPPQEIHASPPQRNLPPPNYGDLRRAEAYQRVNYYRALMGLGLIRQNEKLDFAAQSHVGYVLENGLEHFEKIGNIGYTGRGPKERAAAAGYNPSVVAEVANAHMGSPASAVDIFMDSLYHRIPFIQYNYVDIGVGVATSKYNQNTFFTVLNFGVPESTLGQESPDVAYVVWPLRNSVLEKGSISPGEIPSPPGGGYPITISFDPRKLIGTTRFELRESGVGVVQSNLLTAVTDPNKLITSDIVALMPRDILKPSTSFTVVWEGTVDGMPLAVNWAFSTK